MYFPKTFRKIRILDLPDDFDNQHHQKMRDHIPVHIFLILHFGKNTAHEKSHFLDVHVRSEKPSLPVELMSYIFPQNLIVRIKLFEDFVNIEIHPFPARLFSKGIGCMQLFRGY